jgi:hypothetical protein
MSYKITRKTKPKGAEFILFPSKDGSAGIINFKDMKFNALSDINQKIIDSEIIEINFPIVDHFYTMEYKSKTGWSLKKLFSAIYKTALNAGQYLVQYQPQLFDDTLITAGDFVDKYRLVSNGKKSDIMKKNNIIYINLTLREIPKHISFDLT